MTTLKRPVSRTIDTPYGTLVVALTQDGLLLRGKHKSKGLLVPYQDAAQLALDKLQHLRWRKQLHPLEKLFHLQRRDVPKNS